MTLVIYKDHIELNKIVSDISRMYSPIQLTGAGRRWTRAYYEPDDLTWIFSAGDVYRIQGYTPDIILLSRSLLDNTDLVEECLMRVAPRSGRVEII